MSGPEFFVIIANVIAFAGFLMHGVYHDRPGIGIPSAGAMILNVLMLSAKAVS
jgi:hypothetical protein